MSLTGFRRVCGYFVAGWFCLLPLLAGHVRADVPAGLYAEGRLADAKVELAQQKWWRASFERGEPVQGTVRLAHPVPRDGTAITIRVYDSLGRLLVQEQVSPPTGEGMLEAFDFEIPVPAVVAMRHYLKVLVQHGDDIQVAACDFIYRPPKQWDDYICTIWQRHNAKRIPYLQRIYLTGSQWSGHSSVVPEHFINLNYRYYVESGADWFFSAYHIWMPDKPKTYYFELARKAFLKDRKNLRNLERNPCLSNHVIRDLIRWKFVHEARMHRDFRPLYYSVADEPGLANQAAPFDFCFSPHCQERFRQWLKQRYGTLAALNAQWGTNFKTWDEVRGATTDEILERKDDNFSAWCDHKDFMDSVLIGAYALAKQAMKSHDPDGRIGMGGAQGPAAVGGWDFWKLCQVFDVLEAYYIGNNYELMRSFNPNLIPFHCSFGKGNPERHLIWYLFIHGDRGLLVWDDGSKYVDDEGNYSERAKDFAPLYGELTGGIGKLRIVSQRRDDPIALYHSQANLRVHWILEVRPLGKNWIRRNSWHERINSRYFRLRESWVKLIEDNGFQYRFLCPAQVKRGDLKVYDPQTRQGFKVLILPEILAMSSAEVEAIRNFVKAGGVVIADRLPAQFDEHGKRLEASPLADLFRDGAGGRAILLNRDMVPYHQQRIFPHKEEELKALVGDLLRKAVGEDRVTPEVVGDDGKPVTGVETTVWVNGDVEIIALHRNPLLRINELGPQEYKSNKKFEVPVRLTVTRRQRAVWYDVRSGRWLGSGRKVVVTLQPFEPIFLAAFPSDPGRFTVEITSDGVKVIPGEPCDMARSVYHIAFVGPDGKERLAYRRNLACGPQGGSVEIPLALNDPAGQWTVRVKEIATGREAEVRFAWPRPRKMEIRLEAADASAAASSSG